MPIWTGVGKQAVMYACKKACLLDSLYESTLACNLQDSRILKTPSFLVSGVGNAAMPREGTEVAWRTSLQASMLACNIALLCGPQKL